MADNELKNYVEWNKLDLGKAVTRVRVGPFWCDIKGMPHQQEIYFADSPDSEQIQNDNINTANRFLDEDQGTSSRWRPVSQLEAYVLHSNLTPGAPRYTFVNGAISNYPGFPYGDLYCPSLKRETTTPSLPLATTPQTGETSSKSKRNLPRQETSTKKDSLFSLNQAQNINDFAGSSNQVYNNNTPPVTMKMDFCPFIPTIISNLGEFASQYRQMLSNLKYNGIPTWNIWKKEETIPGASVNIDGYGKDELLTSRSNTATLKGVGSIYDCTRVQVIANNTWTFVRRLFPLMQDTGFSIPWVFPYVNAVGETKYLFYNKDIKIENLHNIGGIYTFTITNYVFTNDNASSNDIPISGVVFYWGRNNDIEIHFLVNKRPYVVVKNRMDDALILSNHVVRPGVEYTLKIEYIGTNLSIQIIGEKEVIIRSKNNNSFVPFHDTANYRPFFFCINCTLVFDFSICYYNNWDPQQEKIPSSFKFDSEAPVLSRGLSAIHKVVNIIDYNDQGVRDASTIASNVIENSIAETFTTKSISTKQIIETKDIEDILDIGFPSIIYNSSTYPSSFNYFNYVYVEPIIEEELPHIVETEKSEGIINDIHLKMYLRPHEDSIYASPVLYSALYRGDSSISWAGYYVDLTSFVNNWNISWSAQEDYKIMIATASVTLINPPVNIMEAISNNLFWISIEDTGYIVEADNPSLYQKKIFQGIITGVRTQVDKSGKITYTLSCEDISFLLRNTFLITNLRFDGMSYLNAMRSLWNRTLLGIPLVIRDNNGTEHVLSGLSSRELTRLAQNKMYSIYLYLNFGLEPIAGKSYLVTSGTRLIEPIIGILSAMNNKYCYPLFFYDPSALSGSGAFVLVFRDFTGEDKIKLAFPPYTANDIKEYIPLTSDQTVIEFTSDLKNLTAEIHIYGINRFSGKPMKHIRRNKNWKVLKNISDPNQWALYSGHVGFRRMYIEYDNKQLYTTFNSLLRATEEKLYWLSYPVEQINNLSALAIISPVGNNGLFTIKVGTSYLVKHILLLSSNISYNAESLTISSSFNGLILKSISSKIIYENFK